MAKLTKGTINAIQAAFKTTWFRPKAEKLMDMYRKDFNRFVRNCDEQLVVNKLRNHVLNSGLYAGRELSLALAMFKESSEISMYIGGNLSSEVQPLFHYMNNHDNYLRYCVAKEDTPFLYTNNKFSTDCDGYKMLVAHFVRDFSALCKRWFKARDQFALALDSIKTDDDLKTKMPKAYRMYQVEVLKIGQPRTPVVIVDYTNADNLLAD